MQSGSWIQLFNRIPAKLHDQISLTLGTGSEIVVQAILRLESDFAILRGRLAGSTDAGRVILLPYDQLVHLAFTKRMNEPEVQALFGASFQPGANVEIPALAPEVSSEAGAPPAVPESEQVSAAQPEEQAPAQGAVVQLATTLKPNPPPAPAGPEAAKASPPSKSLLLARLRARLAEQGR